MGEATPDRRQRPGPPPRPPVTSTLAPPAPPAAPRRPGPVLASAWCWLLSVLAGLACLLAAALDLAGIRERLTEAGAETDPGATPELLREGADTTVAGVLGALAALVLLTLVCLVLLLRRRAGGRSALVVLGLLTVGVDVLAQDLLARGPEVDRVAALAQGGLALVALVLVLTPSARHWMRSSGR